MTVLTGHTLTSTAGAWPSSGKTLLTTSSDSTLIQWDPRSSAPLFKSSIFCPPGSDTLDPEIHGITTLAVAPNGQIAALGSSNGLVKTVNLADGKVVGRLTGHEEGESIEALVFVDVLGGQGGGKGVVLVSGGTDGKGFVWDLATGRVRAELKHDVSQDSPEGRGPRPRSEI
jgi:ribosome assembly protein SQT1